MKKRPGDTMPLMTSHVKLMHDVSIVNGCDSKPWSITSIRPGKGCRFVNDNDSNSLAYNEPIQDENIQDVMRSNQTR